MKIPKVAMTKELGSVHLKLLTNIFQNDWSVNIEKSKVTMEIIVENVHLSESLFILSYLLNEKENLEG